MFLAIQRRFTWRKAVPMGLGLVVLLVLLPGLVRAVTIIITEYSLPNISSGPVGIMTGPTGELSFTENSGDRIGKLVTTLPPTLVLGFGASSIQVGSSTTLTFIITNPNASTALSGVSFGTNLPPGLFIATTNDLANTCGGTVSATVGQTPISLSGGTLAGGASCTITFTVQGAVGTFNMTAVVSSTESGKGTASNTATLTVILIPTILILTSSPNPAGVGQSVTFTATVSPITATGTVAFNEVGEGLAVLGRGTPDKWDGSLHYQHPDGA